MRMGEHDDIELRNATRPQIGRDHIFAEINWRMHPEGEASTVYKNLLAIGKSQEK